MSQVIKINAITVPSTSGDELARRFAARAGAVDDQPGFEGFELMRPTDERDQWLVVTRWADEASFEAWVSSPAFAHGHRSDPGGAGTANGGHSGSSHAPRGEGEGDPSAKPPVSTASELWSYEVVDLD